MINYTLRTLQTRIKSKEEVTAAAFRYMTTFMKPGAVEALYKAIAEETVTERLFSHPEPLQARREAVSHAAVVREGASSLMGFLSPQQLLKMVQADEIPYNTTATAVCLFMNYRGEQYLIRTSPLIDDVAEQIADNLERELYLYQLHGIDTGEGKTYKAYSPILGKYLEVLPDESKTTELWKD
jgi:hypothetical protein